MKSPARWNKKVAAARADNDFFPTDSDITHSFMTAEAPRLRRMGAKTIREPFCGDGAMARVFQKYDFNVEASDLINRGYGRAGIDALDLNFEDAFIVTNPAYKDDIPARFVEHAAKTGAKYLAMVLKVQFWNPQEKPALWKRMRPEREYKICWRPDFLGLGGGMTDVCIWVWDFRRTVRRTEVFLLTKDGRCI